MEFWRTPVSSLPTCDQVFLFFFAALIGVGLTMLSIALLILTAFVVAPVHEVRALLGVGSFAVFIGLCFGGVFWDRNPRLFIRRG